MSDEILVCRYLRTKMAFGSMGSVTMGPQAAPNPGPLRGPEAPDWREGDSTTAVYWCLCTMESAGPDDDFAHAKKCRAGRRCFAGPDVA